MVLTASQIATKGAQLRPALNVPWRPALQAYAAQYSAAAEATDLVQPCMLAAIVARETAAGCGVGLTQITSGVDWTALGSAN
jgi:hypothetical protein